MWMKLMAPPLTSMVALSLAVFSPQDGPAKEKSTFTYRAEVKTADSPDELADVYDRLIKVRAMRLSERPKKLADEAAALYRQAVAATEKGETDKAQGLTSAASELTRALEVSLKTSREQPSDPELPPPPRRSGRQVFVYRTKPNSDEIPPELHFRVMAPGHLNQGGQGTIRSKDVTVLVPEQQATVEAKGDVRVRMIKPDEGQPKRDIIIERRIGGAHPHEVRIYSSPDAPDAGANVVDKIGEITVTAKQKSKMESERARAQSARAEATAARDEAVQQLRLQGDKLNQHAKSADEKIEVKVSDEMLDKLKKTESLAKLHETLAGMHGEVGQPKMRIQILERDASAHDDAAKSIAKLKETHEMLRKLRGEKKGDARWTHLDAARDIYNAARREAEAKHFDRAAELAQAAESLAGLDKRLHEIHAKNYNARAAGLFLEKMGEPLAAVGKPEKTGAVLDRDKSESDEAGPIHGIGVQLSFEDGKGLVQELIAGGPADKNGGIKPGDSLVGIETASGATLGFADKTLAEVTKLLRGPIGSKVKVIVQPKGSTERKVHEIERQQLAVPKPEAPAKPEGGGDGALPPVLD